MSAAAIAGDACTSTSVPALNRSDSCDADLSVLSQRIQEIASEVLRLRLVQSQHKQLEAQLRAAAEKLQQIQPEKVLQLGVYLEHGLRPGGVIGTLGGSHGGVDPESLCGLMECLCAVCDARLASRKQEDLLAVTRWLLQDPQSLIEQLVNLPAAPSNQSKKLAPFLLSCDSGWRGHLNEAGQCYEAFRNWLSCYYQYSLVSGQMQATSDQLHQQEQLLDELSKETGAGASGSSGSGFGSLGGLQRAWRQPSGVRRSSSVQSNSSTGSRRSQSPSADRAAAVGLRLSPRLGGTASSSLGRLTGREVPSSPLKSSGRNRVSPLRSHSQLQSHGQPLEPLPEPQGQSLLSSSSRSSLARGGTATEKAVEPSPRAPRFGAQLSMSGVLGSARASARTTAGGQPPPSPSPRQPNNFGNSIGHAEPPKTLPASRRQIVPAVRARRSPSRDPSLGTGPMPKVVGSFLSRLTPTGVEKRLEECGADDGSNAAPLSPRGVPSSSVLARSRSLQSISEPQESGITPPLSSRGPRHTEPYSARIRCAQITPIGGGRLPTQTPQPHQPRTALSARVTRLASGAPPAAGSGGTPASALRRQPFTRSSLPLPSARRLAPSESATTLRHSDAGSGGTCSGDPSPSAWALATSRSTPSLDMRSVSGRQVVRDTPTATPRPLTSARGR